MDKIDFKRLLKLQYSPPTKAISIVDVPEQNFLMLDGNDNDEKEDYFKKASDTIMRLSYTTKFINKRSDYGPDYTCMPLECLYWSNEKGDFSLPDVDGSLWTLCIMQPYFITKEHIEISKERTKEKKGINPEIVDAIRFETYHEGLCAQLVHIGPYEDRNVSIDKLRAYIEVNEYEINGRYHEIYIGNPLRARPENLKTILRQPVIAKNNKL